MKARRSYPHLVVVCCGLILAHPVPILANGLYLGYELGLEHTSLRGLSLGEDKSEDRLLEEDLEFELSLEYQFDDRLFFYFTGALVDEAETIDSAGRKDAVSGFERREVGLGYYFGDIVDSELRVGRSEFASESDWWVWWDDELDAVSLTSVYGNFEGFVALAEEQARENTGHDFIDPEIDGLRRLLMSLAWEFTADHSLVFYYLDQTDNSRSFSPGDLEDRRKTDEEDADLTWRGISYLGEFDLDGVGVIEIELHAARVSGRETVYAFDDPVNGLSAVTEKRVSRVSGSARSFRLGWSPADWHNWTFMLGGARGDGDSNPDNRRNKAFRQTGLQGDSGSFGELYRPELSNLEIGMVGVAWRIKPMAGVSLSHFRYRQSRRSDEMRDVSIELDPSGAHRDLGCETDLVLTIETRHGMELVLTAARFDPGAGYGKSVGKSANYLAIELAYQF